MKARIVKWGNSLALRIPKPFAEEVRLAADSAVDLSVRNGNLVIVPVVAPELTLEELVSRITPENRHAKRKREPPLATKSGSRYLPERGDVVWLSFDPQRSVSP
jgi:antitoxin MazE